MTDISKIKFGTDGFRAILAENFTFENVNAIVNSISIYARKHYGIEKPILIGYDTRFMADKFAQYTAEILENLGHKVLLSESYIPTPAVAYCAKAFETAGAIMFTASHNPPEYLGIKYIPDYAGPATNEITNELVANLGKVEPSATKGSIEKFCGKQAYFEQLKKVIDFEKIKTVKENLFFDPLYATSNGWFDEVLKEFGIDVHIIHNWKDPNFGGGMPEPKEQFLGELKELVAQNKPGLGFSNDGDADRYAVIDENSEMVSPNEVVGILLTHLIKYKNATGKLVKTVSGSLMLNKLAEHYGIEVVETPVGFKYVGEMMRTDNVIIGGEESGGLSIGTHIPEKDGILADLLVLEAVAYSGKTLAELKAELYDIIGQKFINKRFDLRLTEEEKEHALNFFKNTPPNEFLGKKVVSTCEKDGVKFYLEGGNDWILIRFSGTEPLLRIYFESLDKNYIENTYKFILQILGLEKKYGA